MHLNGPANDHSDLLVTSDGGRTWNWAPASPIGRDIVLVTPKVGWMVGFPAFPGIGRPARRPGILAGSSRGEWAAALPAGRPASSPGIIVMSPAGNSVRNMVRPSPLNSAGDELYVTRDELTAGSASQWRFPRNCMRTFPGVPSLQIFSRLRFADIRGSQPWLFVGNVFVRQHRRLGDGLVRN